MFSYGCHGGAHWAPGSSALRLDHLRQADGERAASEERSNQLPTSQRCLRTSRLAASGERRDRSLDQADNHLNAGASGPDSGHGVLLAYASAGGASWSAGLGGGSDATLSGTALRVAASTTLLADSRSGCRGSPLSWLLLGAGSAGSLAANVAVAEPSVTGRIIAGVAVARVGHSYELSMRGRSAAIPATASGRRRPALQSLVQAATSGPRSVCDQRKCECAGQSTRSWADLAGGGLAVGHLQPG